MSKKKKDEEVNNPKEGKDCAFICRSVLFQISCKVTAICDIIMDDLLVQFNRISLVILVLYIKMKIYCISFF